MIAEMFEVHFAPGGELVVRIRPKRLRDVLPQEARQHLHTARREFSLAMQALVDSVLEATEGDDEATPPKRRRGRIEVKEEKEPEKPEG
ncbi:MAG: hypothetical protein HY683_04895 [Chloroflexi bacterium]|nr:hypothetical protein [Chloroflexota bacterium]